eukprot:6179168-Pleurochrysis_carterae.AAC.3
MTNASACLQLLASLLFIATCTERLRTSLTPLGIRSVECLKSHTAAAFARAWVCHCSVVVYSSYHSRPLSGKCAPFCAHNIVASQSPLVVM